MKADVMLARFPGGGTEHTDCVDWLMDAEHLLRTHPQVGRYGRWKLNDTPITMGRNRALKVAKDGGYDFLLMVDSDMTPDLYLGALPTAVPFLDVAIPFLLDHPGPAIIGAPYCGPPPHENVYVFTWRAKQSDHPNKDVELAQYAREEAAALGGVQEVAALPTGLILIDMRCYDLVRDARRAAMKGKPGKPRPFFYYEYADADETEKSSTEDVVFTRDLSFAGVRQYCAWDSWAGHNKTKTVGKPFPVTPDFVAECIRTAIVNRQPGRGERLLDRKRPASLPPATNGSAA